MQAAAMAPKEWTVLFYNAGHADESKMCTGSLVDLERVGSDANTDVVVLNHRSPWLPERILGKNQAYDGARTYHVEHNASPAAAPRLERLLPPDARQFVDFLRSGPADLTSPEIAPAAHPNMGEADTLKNFLLDGMHRYPARHYALVISGHGAAFGGQSIVHGPEGRIHNEELGKLLEEVAQTTGHKLDLLNLNTCFAANLETLYPLRKAADAVVASENVIFAANQPVARVVADLQAGIQEGIHPTGSDLARLFVEEARRQPLGNLYTETLSAVDLSKIDGVGIAVDRLQTTLLQEKVDPAAIRAALGRARRFNYSDVPRTVLVTDIGSFADEIAPTSERVRVAAAGVRAALTDCVIDEQHADVRRETPTSRALRFVFRRAENDLAGLGGITAYYDDDIHGDGSRVELLRKTEYATAVGAEKFNAYLSGDPKPPTLLQRAAEKHAVLEQRITSKLHVPGVVPIAERVALGAGMLLGFRGLAAMGIPAYPYGFGSYFAGRGILGVVRGTGHAIGLARQDAPLTGAQREQMVCHVSEAVLGAATTTFGLYLLGVLPRFVAWPAAIVAGGIQVGREIGRLLARAPERRALEAEAEQFAALPTSQKLIVPNPEQMKEATTP